MSKPTKKAPIDLVEIDELTVAGVVSKARELLPIWFVAAFAGFFTGIAGSLWLGRLGLVQSDGGMLVAMVAIWALFGTSGWVLYRRALLRYAMSLDIDAATLKAILSAADRAAIRPGGPVASAGDVVPAIKAEAEGLAENRKPHIENVKS